MNRSLYLLSALAIAVLLLPQCTNKPGSSAGPAVPEYNPMITAFTSGIISVESGVKVRFAQEFSDSVAPHSRVSKKVFQVDPDTEGDLYYVDQRTVEFRPKSRFQPGRNYEATLKLSRLFPEVKGSKSFEFEFHTIAQHMDLEITGFRPYDDYKPEMNYIQGSIHLADVADIAPVESVLRALQDGEELPISWNHGTSGKLHEFTIDSVVRKNAEDEVEIWYDGSSIRADQRGERVFTIPSLGNFTVIGHKLVQYPEQHVIINFSDPIRKNQHLDGLIRLSSETDLRYVVEGNTIKAYPRVRQNGTLTVFVEPGIRNTAGKGLKSGSSKEIVFQEIKPSVELLGNGVIVPSVDEVLLPFKAVNLKAVDVKVIRIFEDNIPQFLQVNQLSGNRELKRAGRLIVKKTVDLASDKPVNYGQWNTFSLNLTDLVETEPGAIYRVELNFRRQHSVFPCPGSDKEETEMEVEDFETLDEEEISYWDSYESYYSNWDYYNYEGYSYRDREDPCTPAYYGKRRAVSRNLLASNLGLMAKSGSENQLVVTVTDLEKATPLEGAKVKVYNFQQQLMEENTTNRHGTVELKPGGKAFLVVASHDAQKGYLRLNDGAALSYSMFDVSGKKVEKGIKGYIYGERGVWRPGDSLYLNLIVDDKANPLPENHPVVFEFYDPRGKILEKRIVPGNETGFYEFHTRTSADAATGRYSLKARAGAVTFTKMIRVETIKPNRLKIDLSFKGDTIYPARGNVEATLFSKWLTGATARNLRAEVEVMFRKAGTVFSGYEDYVFTSPARDIPSFERTFYSGNINNQGYAEINKSLDVGKRVPGMLNAIFTTRVFEKSGDFSIDQLTVPCSPFNTYVGLKVPAGDKRGMLLTDTLHTVRVVTLSSDGKPQTKIGLDVKVFKLNWRWWWDASSEDLASYVGRNHPTPVYESTISTKNGEGSFRFKIDYPEWGRYLVMVTDPGGHSAGKVIYIDWPGWAGRARKGDPNASSVLTFSADREEYQVGETAMITIPSSQSGKILISLENGSRVLRQEWIDASGSETKYSIPLTPEMTPNIYVYATLLQPHQKTENDLPIRLFGVIPLKIEDPQTKLHPRLEMPDELRPNSQVKITVSERDHRKMTYTIAMVDEGLLDLTRFRTPDPWSSFYAREALGVKTWDMFDQVMGAFGGRMDGMYNIGGGMDESGEGAKDANRFPPMVKWLGPFTLEGKEATHTLDVPNYIGSVRTMVVAAHNGAYGNAERTTPVKEPLMLLATLPRVLGPGEEVALPVNVFVMDDQIRTVNLEVNTNDMLQAEEHSRTVSFNETGDKIVEFTLKTPKKTGVGKVQIAATSGNHRAIYEIELNIRSSNPPVTYFATAAVEPGDSYEEIVDYIGIKGTNDLMLEVSNIPPVDFGRRLKYLLRYPHGCIEQNTSAVFPQLYLGDVMEIDEKTAQKTEENVKAGIKKLTSFQLSNGSFSYWPGSMKTSSWGSSYAGHFLIEAELKGYEVPQALLRSWKRYQRKASRRWSISGSTNTYEIRQEQILQAYRLFTLALSGNPEIGSMNRLRERTDLVNEARWRLAAAYALAGQKETARELVEPASFAVRDYYDSRYSYGSATRDRAMILEALVLMDRRDDAVPLLEQISEALSSQRWMSTQTTAYSLIAVARFTGGSTTDKSLRFTYAFNDENQVRAETGMPLAQITLDPGNDPDGKISVVNKSEGMAFVRIINTGLPESGKEEAVQKNLAVSVSYYTLDDRQIDISNIEQGTDFKAVYKVTNPGILGHYENVALTTMFPSGWEIHNERLFNTGTEKQSFRYQDVRDDRVMTYFSLLPGRSKIFTIRLNAAYRGAYYLPAIQAEEMYKKDVQVVIPGQWIEVTNRNR